MSLLLTDCYLDWTNGLLNDIFRLQS